MTINNRPWFKNRGYLHVTPQLNLSADKSKILSLLENKNYISRHAFHPLIHSVINERRYKRLAPEGKQRVHSYTTDEGVHKKNIKSRPLHYASHLDALIFGYYAEIILEKYEIELLKYPGLSDCITAYRKLPIGDGKNKSTIHFAKEAFEEIAIRGRNQCEVLKFDIKSFFSRINHQILKSTWSALLNESELPKDHYNVFKAATKFSYLMRDDLRVKSSKPHWKKSGFDEKRLSEIRKKGVISFFENAKDFRDKVKDGTIKLHKYPFKDENNKPVGIPQGLPISAVLANLYLLSFDLKILTELVNNFGVYYRRYSDDIIIISEPIHANYVEKFVNTAIKDSKVEMSTDKTERFIFKPSSADACSLNSYKILKDGVKEGVPFSYLGFEFYGNKTLIKSANLAKFYRRMIRAVKNKAKRALKTSKQNIEMPLVLYKRQLYKLYTKFPLNSNSYNANFKTLVKNDKGEFTYKTYKKKKLNSTNYLTYIHRASEIMNESSLKAQLRNHKKIFNTAINKHIGKAKSKLGT